MSQLPPFEDDVDLRDRMTALPYESLVQGYDRSLYEKALLAKSTVRATAVLAFGLHGMALAFFGLALLLPFNSDKENAETISYLFWGGSALAAVIGGIMTLRRWSILPWRWVVLGLSPWLLIATELMPLVMSIALRRLF